MTDQSKSMPNPPPLDLAPDVLARALIHFLENATTADRQVFNQVALDEARDGQGTSPRCPQGALILAVHLADAVEYVAEGALRRADEEVVDAIRRADDADADDADEVEETENHLDLARSLRESCETLRDAIESATTETRGNVPID